MEQIRFQDKEQKSKKDLIQSLRVSTITIHPIFGTLMLIQLD